jgi:hypothetical protein
MDIALRNLRFSHASLGAGVPSLSRFRRTVHFSAPFIVESTDILMTTSSLSMPRIALVFLLAAGLMACRQASVNDHVPIPVNKKQLLRAMEGHVLATGQLTGLYHR